MPRFVILRHEPGEASDRPLHWDLMLEFGDVLKTWSLAEEPTSGKTYLATSLADHRTAYLDYTGPVAGDRGCVQQWDHGSFDWPQESGDSFSIVLAGKRHTFRASFEKQSRQTADWKIIFIDLAHPNVDQPDSDQSQ